MSTRNLPLLIPRAVLEPDVSRWATVTQVSPLRIRLDGEPTALPITPDTLTPGLTVNDRVWVALATNGDPSVKARRVVVLGRSGGITDSTIIADIADLDTRLTAAEATLATLVATWPGWNPTLTNLTVGAGGTLTANRRIIGKTVDWYFQFIFGTGSSVGTNPAFTLPATPASFYPQFASFGTFPGTVHLNDAATASRQGNLSLSGTSTVTITYWTAVPTLAQITSTVPWNWGTGDSITAWGTFVST